MEFLRSFARKHNELKEKIHNTRYVLLRCPSPRAYRALPQDSAVQEGADDHEAGVLLGSDHFRVLPDGTSTISENVIWNSLAWHAVCYGSNGRRRACQRWRYVWSSLVTPRMHTLTALGFTGTAPGRQGLEISRHGARERVSV